MRIAICGIRGIPACYGGFETFAEELSYRLVDRGHEVLVYGRSHVIDYPDDTYRGVKIKLLSAPQHKYFETPLHTLRCLIDLVKNPPDVLLVCNAANSPWLFIPRLFTSSQIAINLDGIERMRAKWNTLGKLWYRFGEICATWFPHKLISDADVIRDYYLKSFSRESVVIRYGYRRGLDELIDAKVFSRSHQFVRPEAKRLFESFNLEPNKYILYVSRIEPENNAHVVIEAYNRLSPELKTRAPLVIVGDAPYSTDYKRHLRRIAGDNVIFTGYRFGEDYQTLQLGAYCYIQATEVGGTHPALVEAMGFGNCVIANETPENVEVLAESGLYYKKNNQEELSRLMARVLDNPELTADYQKKALARARENFDWEVITDAYEDLFYSMLGKPKVHRKTAEETKKVSKLVGNQ